MIAPNYDETVKFLQSYRPPGTGFWLLMAIRVDKKQTVTLPFAPTEVKEVKEWLEKMGGDRDNPDECFNLYFHVNPTIEQQRKKASKSDIRRIEYLHVDLDPRPGQDLTEEKGIFLNALTNKRPEGVPQPTFIVDSGAGYHAYWRLSPPVEIQGDEAKANDVERYNVQLERHYGGDHCHNVDRILRLPGTINRPDQKKRDKGRTTYLCRVVEENDISHPLGTFTPAPLVQSDNGFADHLQMVNIQGAVESFDDIDKLDEWKVPLHTKIVIVQGFDPDEPNRWESRSEPLWYVTNSMVRSGVPHEVILSVLENPVFKISESILEKGNGARKYALKQINDCAEAEVSGNLHRLNKKHAMVRSVGGKCRIISEEWDEELGRTSLDYQTATDFTTFYMNEHEDITVTDSKGDSKVLSVPLGKWWLTHPNRRSYERIIFAPGRDIPGSYNLWTGFAVEARAGDCSLYLTHLLDNICCGNQEYYDYLIGWMATAVQRPGEQGHVAIVIQGQRGAGKGVFASQFGSLFGRHFMPVTQADHLVGKFNAHLRDCVVLFGDEAFYAGDKKHEGMLKTLITERTLAIEGKGVDVGQGRNYVHLIMASNDDWVVPAGENERRFFILKVGQDQMQSGAYFLPIIQQMENGGREALLHFLMHYDLSEVDVRSVPKTDALQMQKQHTFEPLEEWWFSKLQDGEIDDGAGWPTQVPRAAIRENMVAYNKAYNIRNGRANATILGKFMLRVLPGDQPREVRLNGSYTIVGEDGETRVLDRPRGYKLPSLAECREYFEGLFGGKFNWSDASGTTADVGLGLAEEVF